MNGLERWTSGRFTHGGVGHPTFRRGEGPGVIVVHELPGITPEVIRFADDVVDGGFTVVMPSLVGTPGRATTMPYVLGSVVRMCVSREFTTWALRRTSPVTAWLRGLAAELHAELGGPGVGAVGMCFSGGFALAMMVDASMAAPVLSQPSLPLAGLGRQRGRDLNLSPADLDAARARADAGCPILALQFAGDPLVGQRLDELERTFPNDQLTVRRLPRIGRQHSVLAAHRQDDEVAATIAYLRRHLSS